MSKRCTYCGTYADDNEKICPGCGQRTLVHYDTSEPNDSNKKAMPKKNTRERIPLYKCFFVEPDDPYAVEKALRSLIFTFSVIAVFIIACSILVAVDNHRQAGKAAETTTRYHITAPEFSKGKVTGNTYINEWADLRFISPEGYVSEDLSEVNDLLTTGDDSSISADAYFDNANGEYVYVLLDSKRKSEESDSYNYKRIAGRKYATAFYQYKKGDTTVYLSFYVRFISRESESVLSNKAAVIICCSHFAGNDSPVDYFLVNSKCESETESLTNFGAKETI